MNTYGVKFLFVCVLFNSWVMVYCFKCTAVHYALCTIHYALCTMQCFSSSCERQEKSCSLSEFLRWFKRNRAHDDIKMNQAEWVSSWQHWATFGMLKHSYAIVYQAWWTIIKVEWLLMLLLKFQLNDNCTAMVDDDRYNATSTKIFSGIDRSYGSKASSRRVWVYLYLSVRFDHRAHKY